MKYQVDTVINTNSTHIISSINFFFKKIIVSFTYLNVYLCVPHVYNVQGGQKRPPNLPELELWAVVSCLTWVLGTQFCSSARATSPLNPSSISPDLFLCIVFSSWKASI